MIKLILWWTLLCSECMSLTILGGIYGKYGHNGTLLCLIIMNIILLCVCAILTPHFMKEKEKNNDLHRNE